ncbi:MAG TPA: efflux RND transporter periplasmic adaptor subunit [Candidatus Heimdallarchaeota archaeon]|nr:efflux RND transporter periplasmic adaptor subunit [Candidatus Heimdallarchaeota archaeon]
MKAKILLILFLGILIGAAATYFVLPKLTSDANLIQESEKQLYSCGMHPEVISEKPGNCPICGMKLTPIKGSAQASGQATAEEAGQERKVLYWRAPMDPTEIYDKPGKSKMGMDLVPVYEGEEAGGAGSIMIDGTLQQNMNLRIADVEQRHMSNVIRVHGRVTYAQDREFSVNTKINGWVEKLYVNTLGQKVRKGQVLLEIYSPELVSTQEEYLLALNNYKKLSESPYESIRKNAERMLGLARSRLEYWDISSDEIDKIKKTGKVRRSFPLSSQITGVVTHKAVKEGDKIGPGMVLFHIADLSKVWVEASVYEGDLALIKEGQRAELELDQIQGLQLEGKVDFIYPYLDQKSRANNVRLVFDNPGQILKPEMYATVRIFNRSAEQAMAIPTEAVIHSGKRKIVFVTKGNGKFEPREVKIGAESEDGFVEIISGLFIDEKIVVSGQFLLDSESQTREAIAKMRALQTQSTQSKTLSDEESTGHTHEVEVDAEPHEGHTETEMPAVMEHSHEELEHDKLSTSADKLFACPMHPEFITSDPNAKCPDCGMNVVPAKELGAKLSLEGAEFYTCPMHPDFLTTDKNARCPECGMKLEKVKKK